MGSLAQICLFLALLIAPGMAALRLNANHAAWIVLGWYAIASIITYFLYAWDKRRAETGAWREPERGLHFLELIGGWPGAFIAQRRLRHKSSKLSFQLVFWIIVALHQFIAIDSLLDWRLSRTVLHAVTQSEKG